MKFPTAENGVLDLTGWDFAQNGPVNLSGEWEFYWERFLDDKSLADEDLKRDRMFISVPRVWNGQTVNGKKITSNGYATYRLKVLLPPLSDPMAFKFMSMGSAFRIYANGKEVSSEGVVGTTRETMIPEWRPHIAQYTPEGDRMDIILHVSNFNHRKGGAFEGIKFGRFQDIQRLRERNLILSFFVCGSIFIIGVYHLVLFLLRRRELAALYLGIFCLLISTYDLVYLGERWFSTLFPHVSWELMVKLTNLTCFLTVPFSLLFLDRIYSDDIKNPLHNILTLLFFLLASVVLLTPARIYTHVIPVFHVVALTGALYAVYVLILCLSKKREGALTLLSGTIILVAAAINDILYDNQVIKTGQLIHLGMFAFILTQSIMLSRRFSKAYATVEKQSRELAESNLALTTEIDMRRKTEAALKESEEKYRLLIENASEAIFIIQDLSIKFNNRRTEEISGYSRDELASVSFFELVSPEERDSTIKWYVYSLENNKIPENNHFSIVSKTGDTIWVGMNAVKITWEGKDALLCFASDVSQEKKLAASLERAHKMEAIGTLAGGVAHDLNNVLSGIVSYPDLLLMQLPEDSPLRSPIETIQKTGQKAAAIVMDLLTLARRGVATQEVVSLNDIIQDYLQSPEYNKMLSFHKYVKVKTNLRKDLWNVHGSPFHLAKTIMNLISNAAEAMPDGGMITITTKNLHLKRAFSGLTQIPPGDYTIVTISDTGIGIFPKDQEKIFEPFYSKKVMGRSGTGLGMAVVWGTVKDHNGYIDLDSSVGKGSAFTLYFPATTDAKTDRPEKKASLEMYKGKGESVLVVDDIKDQREIASQILTHLGYSVKTASNGEEAVEYLKEHKVELLVLDMVMDPGIDGLETYKRAIRYRPDQKAIITSGYAATNRVNEAKNLGLNTYLKKPYTLEALGVAVRNELSLR